jgi:hypothetical protein
MPRSKRTRNYKRKYRARPSRKGTRRLRGGSINYSPTDTGLNKTIWLLWLQGWDKAPWIVKQVKETWEKQNDGWKIITLSSENLNEYVDIPYIGKGSISPQAKSDIIRLSILEKHGGVWADATLLCMKPLDSWVWEHIKPSDFWMYHGADWGADVNHGPASWFIVSKKGSYIISKWKSACDIYWAHRETPHNYLWMDSLFKDIYNTDPKFRTEWDATINIDCEAPLQPHMFTSGSWKSNDQSLKDRLKQTPPFVIKMSSRAWELEFPNIEAKKCTESNGYFAIQMAKRAI